MKRKLNFDNITKGILYNDNFLVLKKDVHHGSNKYDHCKRVSKVSYFFAKVFKADIFAVTRAALLHDFFTGTRKECEENSYFKHPITSAKNAKKYFKINNNEENIIKTHMYHLALTKKYFSKYKYEARDYLKEYKPDNKNSVIVCLSDLLVSIYEVVFYKLRYSTSLYLIFLLNFLSY